MVDTYGFGGSEPARDLPNRDGDATKTSTGASPAPVRPPLDGMFTDNVRGQSPVSGLGMDSDWEVTSIHPSWHDTVSVGAGTDTVLGTWPIENYGNNPRQKGAPAPMRDWTGNAPGEGD